MFSLRHIAFRNFSTYTWDRLSSKLTDKRHKNIKKKNSKKQKTNKQTKKHTDKPGTENTVKRTFVYKVNACFVLNGTGLSKFRQVFKPQHPVFTVDGFMVVVDVFW